MDGALQDRVEVLAREIAGQARTIEDVNGLMRLMMKSALERMLDTEMDVHLGRRPMAGPVRIFVSAAQGTLFAGEFGQPALEHDGKVVQRLFPMPNRHCPPFGSLANRHVNQLQC